MDDAGFEDGDDESLTILSRAELADRVRQRTAALENVMDTMVDVLIKIGPDGRIQLANAAVTDRLGYDVETVVGKPIDYLLADPAANPELSSMVTAGELVDALLCERQVTDVELTLEAADGELLPTILSASVMTDEDGDVDGIVCVATDISQRVEAESRAEFLHSLLRHDLGNTLTVVDGYLELLAETDLDETQREYLSYARQSVEGATDLIENVRLLHQLADEEPVQELELAAVLEETVDRHRALANRQGIDVTCEVGSETVLAGRLVTELFATLLENALIHSGGSRVQITADRRDDRVVVDLEDDGRGFPDDLDVFERGTTAGENGGTGLGTYLAARIAETYGGSVSAGDAPLGGARFRVTLPPADGDLDERPVS